MKCALLLVILGFIALSSASTCYNQACSASGGQCGIAPISGTFYECQGGYYCNGATFTQAGTCQAQLAQGANCSGAITACGSGLTCKYNTNDMTQTCQPTQWGPGYLCTSDAGCYNYNQANLQQTSGQCVSGRCAALAAGAACNMTATTQCSNGYYCNPTTLTCTANPAAGSPCNSTWNYCSDSRASTYLFCSTAYQAASATASGTCVPYFNQDAGGNCAGPMHCKQGLVCQNSATTGFGTCATPSSSSSGKTCNNANSDFTECGALEYCRCTSASSTATTTCQKIPAYPSNFVSTFNSAVSCASSAYGCFNPSAASGSSWVPSDSCTGSCYKSVCSAFAKTNNGNHDTCVLTAAQTNSYNKCLKAGAATYFLAPAVAFVALIAFLF